MFAVLYDFVDGERRQDILHHVLLNDSVMSITTPYMRFYELEALCALGEHDRVLKEMRSYWGGMLKIPFSFLDKLNGILFLRFI